MPLWIELLVALLIVYGVVMTLAVLWLSRRMRLSQLLRLRAARDLLPGSVTKKEEVSNG